MASYEFRIPSKAVPYGYVNKTFEGDFTDDEIGLMYARAVRALWVKEAGDLDEPSADLPKATAQPTAEHVDEVSQADAEEAVKSELGGIETGNAWDEDAPEVVKPWDNPPTFDFE